MCQVNVTCPECGTINRNLYLDETEGSFECETCGCSSVVPGYRNRAITVCPECGCTEFDFRTLGDRKWRAACRDCGHEMTVVDYYYVETGGRLKHPVYKRSGISRLMEPERRCVV